MSQFAVECVDRPSSAELRDASRAAHLAYLRSLGSSVKLAGPLLNEQGRAIGSLLIIEAVDAATANEILANDPYVQADLFEQTSIRPLRIETGKLAETAG